MFVTTLVAARRTVRKQSEVTRHRARCRRTVLIPVTNRALLRKARFFRAAPEYLMDCTRCSATCHREVTERIDGHSFGFTQLSYLRVHKLAATGLAGAMQCEQHVFNLVGWTVSSASRVTAISAASPSCWHGRLCRR
jgi:hypothetical protein